MSEKGPKVCSKITDSAQGPIRHDGYNGLEPNAVVTSEAQPISRVYCSGPQPRPFRMESGRLFNGSEGGQKDQTEASNGYSHGSEGIHFQVLRDTADCDERGGNRGINRIPAIIRG